MGKSMGAFVTKWKRTSGREENFYFTIDQMRSKFKKCVSECKKGALTIKSGTGIKRFQEDKSYGEWFCAAKMKINSYSGYKPLNTTRNNNKVSCMLFYHKSKRHYHRISRRDVFHRPFHILKGIFPFYYLWLKYSCTKRKGTVEFTFTTLSTLTKQNTS